MVIFVLAMTQNYDIQVRSVHDYNAFVGVGDLHPLVSVIRYDELPHIRHCRTLWGVYGLFLLEDEEERLGYGSGRYGYRSGSIVCVAPAQIGGAADDGTTFQRRGWALLFSPELFHGATYEKELFRMEFFRYHVNEALVLTDRERQDCKTLLRILQSELCGNKQENLIMKLIELILTYCSSFFKRQYPTEDGKKCAHIVSRLERLLDDYYTAGEQYAGGVPTVRFCADNLCVAPNYLGDLIRKETGDSASHFIGRYITHRAKSLLMSGKSVAETAYTLGFDFPSHLTRLFNRIEGMTPSVYARQIREMPK